MRAAKEAGADAIHPGYGFLAESADFAERVEAAGLVFVGPTAEALRRGGDKLAAKEIARQAGVPVVPDGEPEEIGFPLVVKAAAGGGGRGMRVVRSTESSRRQSRRRGGRRGGVRRRPRLLRALRRASAARRDPAARRDLRRGRRPRGARVLDPAPPPEGARGVALPRARRRAAQRMADAAVPSRRASAIEAPARPSSWSTAGLLVPRAERPNPGRAPGHRARAWRRPRRAAAPHRRRETPTVGDTAAGPRGRSAPVRRGSPHVPSADRPHRTAPPSGCDPRRAGVEEGDEIGLSYDPLIAKLIAHGDTRGALGRLAEALGRRRSTA